eukprot:1243223-Lingulodinium_polyedra.AAC.1
MECARRAICEPLQRQTVDSTALLRTVVESTVFRHSGSRVARLARSMRTPLLVFAWSVRGVRFASLCGGARSV